MSILSNNRVLAPFFSKPMTFTKGLDPLGLQNTSDATFSMLLRGLNNVTGRIRYYSFYCWLLDEYAKRNGSLDPKEQQKFIRRAEFVLALVNRSIEGSENSAIPGSNYATSLLSANQSVFNLDTATYNKDGSTEGTYWKYSSGAFGQYYIGSLFDIGIVSYRKDSTNIYIRNPHIDGVKVSGESLAKYYDDNISKSNKTLFFECIEKGKISRNDLEILFNDFNQSLIPDNSDESNALLDLLIEQDNPRGASETENSYRAETIYHLLKLTSANGHIFDRAFTHNAYYLKGAANQLENECLTGWYYYQFNEFWQYACLGVFNGTMDYLYTNAGNSWMPISELVENVTNEIISEFKQQNLIKSESDKVELIFNFIDDTYDEIEIFESIQQSKDISRASNSLLLILKIYLSNKTQLDRLKSFGVNHSIERDGNAPKFFLKFERFHKSTMKEFLVEFLYTNIIHRHQFVAFKKMTANQSTQLFLIEEGRIRYLENFNPSLTGPRIVRLIGFLHDLGVLKENNLTKKGEELLTKLDYENA